jgi:hypothetical protein
MPLPPGSNRWVPHFEDPEIDKFARNTFDGIKDLNAAIKALNTKANGTQSQTTALAAQVTNISNQVTLNSQNITNITNNNIVNGVIDCGTFEEIYR